MDRNFNGSDHNTIAFDLRLDLGDEEILSRKWHKADWGRFSEELMRGRKKLFVPKIINEKKLDKMVEKLYGALNKALDEVISMTASKGRRFCLVQGRA